jgi:hypothetical protein
MSLHRNLNLAPAPALTTPTPAIKSKFKSPSQTADEHRLNPYA